ncbi:hypothetical protein [Porticoccus sp.]|uniref:hypothetical protein n=1 Tax=Porticoccus sp. TaxID=2024853 RepID=UPI003F6A09F2
MRNCDQPGILSVEQALDQLLNAAKPLQQSEEVPLALALGRVLADDQHSPVDVPPADNSAMDGFALNSGDACPDGETVFNISQRIPAGAAGVNDRLFCPPGSGPTAIFVPWGRTFAGEPLSCSGGSG